MPVPAIAGLAVGLLVAGFATGEGALAANAPLATDSFARTVGSGWGTASKGGAWSAVAARGAKLTVSSGKAHIRDLTRSGAVTTTLKSITASDVDVTGTMTMPGKAPIVYHAYQLRTQADAAGTVSLGELPDLTYKLDERRQVLVVKAADSVLQAQQLRPDGASALPIAPSGTGAVLNYDVVGTGGRTQALSGVFDARATSRYGVLSGGWLAQAGSDTATGGVGRVTRLDTTLTETDVDGMRRVRFGDMISGGLSWTRPVRMGGAQLASDFGMRPDLVTFPLPELGGRVGVPSTVDVLVNGVRQLSQSVQPGPFELRQPPIVTGAGDVAVVVRDALGQESVRNLSFYASPTLLRPGLASYSVEGGLVRTGYGLVSDDYADPGLVGTLRYGLLDWVTAELHTEMAARVRMAGAGVALNLLGLGIASVSAAGSDNGLQYAVGFERIGRWLSLSASLVRATAGFRDLAAAGGDPVPRTALRLGAGLALGAWGNLHAAYVAEDGGLVTGLGPLANTASVGHARVLSATWTRPLTDAVSLYATGYRDFAARGADGVQIGVSIALGTRSSADLGGGLTGGRMGGTAQAAQAAVTPGDWGWRAGATTGAGTTQQQAEGSYLAPWGTLSAGVEHLNGDFDGRLGAQGALVLAGGDLFVANRVDDSYAVVETPGLSGVPVLRENRPVGRTDADGQLLIPDLRGWEPNRIAIDPNALPADVQAGSLQQLVRPQDHSGVAVRFALRRGGAALVRLVDAAGKPLAAGATATLHRTGRQVPVGHDGDVYLIDLSGDEEVSVVLATGSCHARFHYAATPGDLPTIGPVPCMAAAP